MSNFTIYNVDSVEIAYDSENPITKILKFCSTKNQIFLLSTKFELFHGLIDKNSVKLKLLKQGIIDIDLFDGEFYAVDENGCVFRNNCQDIEIHGLGKEIIVITSKSCPHGYKSITEKIRISRINCNYDGILFTSFNNELYGMGNFSDVLQSEYPIKIECFSGLKILQVATGNNFAVILTCKRNEFNENDCESLSINDEPAREVFLSTDCPRCPSKSNINKNVSKSTTETSMASSSSGTFGSDDNLTKNLEILNKSSTPIKSSKDLAINFFLESLSISSEDFIEAGKQTKLLKENVSNITSMVYEGVKTLSRHMSGSDSNDTPPLESYEIIDEAASKHDYGNDSFHELNNICLSETSSVDNDEIDIHSEYGWEKKINNLCRVGNSLLTTGVWSFGSVNREGQLGTGDQVKRNIIIPVLKLQNQGVTKISCGKDHSIALTLDGRLYLWGSNFYKQISNDNFDEYSAAKLYKNKEKVLDAICCDKSSIILLNDLNVFEETKLSLTRSQLISTSFEISKKNVINDNMKTPQFLSSENYFIVNHNVFTPISECLSLEEKFLNEMLTTYNTIIKPFLKKTSSIANGQLYDNLIHLFLNIINITSLNVKTIKEYYLTHINCTQIVLVKNLNELISLYRNYLKKFCNVLCINGFEHILYTIDKKLVNSSIQKIFETPFRRIWGYIELFDQLLKYENELTHFLEEKRKILEKFRSEKDVAIDEADNTLKFWKNADKIIVSELHDADRRLIVDSKDISLKLTPSGPFSTQRFILFSDYLCHYTSILFKFPLSTLWVEQVQSNDSKKHLLKIITPEISMIVIARSHEDKLKWLEEISKYIKYSLKKPLNAKVPVCRNTSYQFSDKHLIYSGVKYFGMWSNGHMHGIGRLEFPDGKVYNGLMTNSEIQGFGQMFTPSQGTYEGNFENGKYHGYGVLEMKNKERYKGNFKNGDFSGHGKLENDRFSYFGEFLKNMKSGYGVLDDKYSGAKYLGMFENNKKHGFGTLFTVEGDYFNGIFIDDNLAGDGLALLADGSFYRGELSIYGPNGKGVLYMSTTKKECLNLDDYKSLTITGRYVTGSFTGTWSSIKIVNGSISMPIINLEDVDIYTINPIKKWCSLFKDWENEVFNDSLKSSNNNTIWNKISVYISNSKRREKLKSDGFEMKNQKNAQNIDSLTIGDINLNQQWDNPDTISMISNLSIKSSSQFSKRKTLDKQPFKMPEFFHKNNNSFVNQKSVSNEMLIADNKRKNEFNNANKRIFRSNESIPNSDIFETRKKSKDTILEITPNFGVKDLKKEDVKLIKEYLFEAFKDMNHPLGVLISKISKCFYFSYGHWNNKKPTILTRQALDELESISIRIYQTIRKLFPALPEDRIVIDDEIISHRYFYSVLLSNSIYSSLFVLYASKCSPLDEICQRRIRFTDKKSDEELLKFLKIEPLLLQIIKNEYFRDAIACFRQVETKFCPKEMLTQIKDTYEYITKAALETVGEGFILNTDCLIPLTIFLVLRSNIPHIGAELLLLEDLLESEYELNGESGACFTHIKASYGYIISNNFFED